MRLIVDVETLLPRSCVRRLLENLLPSISDHTTEEVVLDDNVFTFILFVNITDSRHQAPNQAVRGCGAVR